jgi:hypothetical protein
MNRRQSLAAGFVMALSVMLVASAGRADTRLQWESGGGTVSWHRSCAFAHPTPDPGSVGAHRFIVLRASLRTLARGDAALYAVYLQDSQDLEKLGKLLDEVGSPSAWTADSSAPTGHGICMEWIPMEANGVFTVRADEARYPDKAVVAVINGEGEILGTHSLWSHHGDVASLGD